MVDHSVAVQRLLMVALEPLGVQVRCESDGRAGLKAAVDDPPDVVVLDIGLPGEDGWEMLGRARAEPALEGVAVLVLTADARDSVRDRAYRDGADIFMTKPFRPAEFRAAVRRLLGAADGGRG